MTAAARAREAEAANCPSPLTPREVERNRAVQQEIANRTRKPGKAA